MSQKVSPFQAGDHKAARKGQDSITKTNMKHNKKIGSTKKHHLGMVCKKSLEGVNMFHGNNLTFNSDVNLDT